MKNFCYNVNTYCENEELTYRTNDIHHALDDFFESVNEGVHADIVNGYTGEVLAIVNNPECEDYATDEMALMMAGYLAEQNQVDAEDVPICSSCGGEIDENGNCEWCGRHYGSVDVPAEETGSLLDFLEEMVAQGKAIKLGSLPS